MRKIEISNAAVDAADIFSGQLSRATLRQQLERAIPVALREIADEMTGHLVATSGGAGSDSKSFRDGYALAIGGLRSRADGLDPQGGRDLIAGYSGEDSAPDIAAITSAGIAHSTDLDDPQGGAR